MRLISLDIANFRVIKQATIRFHDSVIGIIGRNGSGKSSIIEAITWALYGTQAARSGKDEIRATYADKSEECRVSLEFAVNDMKYRVVRRIVGNNHRGEVELYRGDASESVGVNETKQYVGQLLGLDWRGFKSSFLARQQELNALSDVQPSVRQNHIAGMLGIERLDKAIKMVKDDTALHQRTATALESQLSHKEQIQSDVRDLTERISQLAKPLQETRQELEKAEQSLAGISQAYKTEQTKQGEWHKVSTLIQAEQRTITDLADRLKTLETEMAALELARGDLDRLKEPLAQIKPLRDEMDLLLKAKAQADLKSQLDSEHKRLALEIESYEKTQVENRAAFKKLLAELNPIPKDIEALCLKARQDLEQARDEYSHLAGEIKSRQKETTRIQNQLESMTELGPDSVCDRCHRPMGDDLEQIKGHIADELRAVQVEIAEASTRLSALKSTGESLKARSELLVGQRDTSIQLKHKQDSLEKEYRDRESQLAGQRKVLDEVVAKINNLGAVEFDPARIEELRSTLAGLEKDQQRFNQIEGSLRRLPELGTQIEQSKQKQSDCLEKETQLMQTLETLESDETRFVQLGEELSAAQKTLEQGRAAHIAVARESELAEKELEGKNERLDEFERTAQLLEESRSAHYHGEKLGTLFGDFRKNLIASIRPTLSDLSSRLMDEMTDGKYSLVDLDDKYNLRVMDSGEYFGVERYSGGEKDLANLCLRLAISLALTESAGLNGSFIILDEVFGSQDVQRKELILKALANLKNRFPQILLITHVEDIKDGVEDLITVEPTGAGWSEVIVDNAPL